MTYDDFSRYLGKAGITVREFAFLLKKHPNSVTNNAQKKHVPNELGIIAALIGEMAENNLEFKSIIEGLELKNRKPRDTVETGKFGGTSKVSLIKIKRTDQ
ncbi:DNA-binding protein [Dickeya zeae]|uniref:DNA-binding protein n=1 Tax=Dickeya zeae TaxID=204042 RepID=UPI000C9C1531|nr:DNA-binding protein [Dickeya zeae]AUQ27471.1 DNA-binding protein [Dickeya zeae]UJR57506.1 XRE family transcriptional regulator [Dickeya zeae]